MTGYCYNSPWCEQDQVCRCEVWEDDQLKLQAGLTHAEPFSEEDWIGTESQWAKYEELKANQDNL